MKLFAHFSVLIIKLILRVADHWKFIWFSVANTAALLKCKLKRQFKLVSLTSQHLQLRQVWKENQFCQYH